MKKNKKVLVAVSVIILAGIFTANYAYKKYKTFKNNCVNISAQNQFSDKEVKKLKNLEEAALAYIIEKIKPYVAYDENGPLKLIRLGKDYDGGYVVPEKAIDESDALFGYGIASDISFEDQFALKYDKLSFGFDCASNPVGIKNKIKSEKCKFIHECIGTDKYIYNNQKSSELVSTFSQQINKLGLNDKKILIKMDIEGAEYESMDSILDNAENITGIVIEVHFADDITQIIKLIDLINKIEKNFKLVHLHANNAGPAPFDSPNLIGKIPRIIELTYINNNLVKKYEPMKDLKFPKEIDMKNLSKANDYFYEIK